MAAVRASQSDERAIPAEDRLRRVVDTTPALVHSGLADGNLDFFNRGWLDFLGASMQELCGWRWTAWIHPDDVTTFVDKWRICLTTGDSFEAESRVRRADGEYRWFLHRKVPFRDDLGRIIKWYGSSIDIEERKRAEIELRRSEAYLAEGQRLTHTGSWAYDPAGVFDFLSRETFNIFGFDPTKPTLRDCPKITFTTCY